jgi:hypothetical protein
MFAQSVRAADSLSNVSMYVRLRWRHPVAYIYFLLFLYASICRDT